MNIRYTAAVGMAALLWSGCGTSKVQIGKDEVGYAGTATREQAAALGRALKGAGYFQDRGVTVMVATNKNGTVLSYAVKDGVWNDRDSVTQYGLLTTRVAAAIPGGLPVTVRLVNANFETKNEQVIHPKLMVGTDEIMYSDGATERDAEALSSALKGAGYLQNRGASILLAKSQSGAVVSFVVKDGMWEPESNVAVFAELGRTVAPSVGGLPMKVRLVNSNLVVKKEIPLS